VIDSERSDACVTIRPSKSAYLSQVNFLGSHDSSHAPFHTV